MLPLTYDVQSLPLASRPAFARAYALSLAAFALLVTAAAVLGR